MIPDEAKAWVVSLASQKPKDLGYAEELWTTRLLAQHARDHCEEKGHPSLRKLGRGTVSRILAANQLKPHKIEYFLERRDPDFDTKMANVAWLKQADAHYAEGWKIRVILDNHSAHTSKETRAYLATVPNRFEFIFTPTHGSWLNLIEVLFSKLARTLLRGIRADSPEELTARIEQHLEALNQEPVVFRWKHALEEIAAS